MHLHDLRPTHTTVLLREGTHPKPAQKILGHANIVITLDIYSYVLPSIDYQPPLLWKVPCHKESLLE